jgi:RNA polymerase sigma-70 factor (ECF subfamily)
MMKTSKPPLEGESSPQSADRTSDRSLLARFRAGDQDAATALYLRYARRLHSLARNQTGPGLAVRIDPDDIVQSVFRTFFRRATRGEYEVPAGDELWKLFLVIGLNKIRSAGEYHHAARRDVRRTQLAAQDDRESTQSGKDAEALAVLEMVVDELLGELPDSSRRMVELRVAGHAVAEIAALTGRAKRSVERILTEFRRMLAARIEER